LALPSLADVVFVVVLLIPGFLALCIFKWLAIYERKLSDYPLLLWSLFFSLLIYAVFSWHTGISNFDEIRDTLLFPENLLKILTLGITFGIGSGLIGRFVRTRRGEKIIPGDAWQASMRVASRSGCWVIIHTKDGKEYKGILHYTGGKGEPREISIRKPKLILRDNNWKVLNEIEMGKEIFFKEVDLQRIVFFKEV